MNHYFNLPKHIIEAIEYHQALFRKKVYLYNASVLTQKTFVAIINIPEETKSQLYQYMQNIDEKLRQYLILQPYQGYHINLQWTNSIIMESIQNEIITEISELFTNVAPITGNIDLAYLSEKGVFGTLEIDIQKLVLIRNKLNSIFKKHNLKPGIKGEKYNWIWTSLARYQKDVPPKVKELFLNLQKKQIRDIKFSKCSIVIMDPFFYARDNKILKEVNL